MPKETLYSAVSTEPDQLARATTQTIEMRVYYDGDIATVTETGSTVTVNDNSGDAIVDAKAVTNSGGFATYEIASTVLPATLDYSDGWMVFWSLVMPDGETYVFKRSAALVHSRLYPPVAETHLTQRHTELKSYVNKYGKSLQAYITAAWIEVNARLDEGGRRPWLILNSSALFLYHLKLSLAFTFRDMAQSLAGARYAELEATYLEEAEIAWNRISLKYDDDEDQIPDEERTPAGPPIMLTRPGRYMN